MHINTGGHAEIPESEVDSWDQFLYTHLQAKKSQPSLLRSSSTALIATTLTLTFFTRSYQENKIALLAHQRIANQVIDAWQHQQIERAIENLFAMGQLPTVSWYFRDVFFQSSSYQQSFELVRMVAFQHFLLRPTVNDLLRDLRDFQTQWSQQRTHQQKLVGSYFLAFDTLFALISSQNGATANLSENLFFFMSRHIHEHYPFVLAKDPLENLIHFYLQTSLKQNVSTVVLDEKIMEQAQQDLIHESEATRLYSEIKMAGLETLITEPVVTDGHSWLKNYDESLSIFYQDKSWERFIKPKFNEIIATQIKNGEATPALLEQIHTQYVNDRERQWLKAINAI